MNLPGEVRYVDVAGDGDEVIYVRDRHGVWRPVDLIDGPGYLTDVTILLKDWRRPE